MEVDVGDVKMCPFGDRHCLPFAEGFESEFKEPFGFVFLGRDKPNDVFVQPCRYDVGLHVGCEAVFVLLVRYIFDYRIQRFKDLKIQIFKDCSKIKSRPVVGWLLEAGSGVKPL